jgi:hypothetical protein
MSERNTFSRSLHDLGLAGWFGGSLMGAVGLNGATAEAAEPQERLRLSSLGWKRWAPVNAVAVGAHVVGAVGLLIGNRDRVRQQTEGQVNSAVKTALTAVALGLTAYSGALGRRVEQRSAHGSHGVTEPAPGAPADLADAQRKLQQIQWAIPAVTGALVLLSAQQGEQQRPSQQLPDRLLGR